MPVLLVWLFSLFPRFGLAWVFGPGFSFDHLSGFVFLFSPLRLRRPPEGEGTYQLFAFPFIFYIASDLHVGG